MKRIRKKIHRYISHIHKMKKNALKRLSLDQNKMMDVYEIYSNYRSSG